MFRFTIRDVLWLTARDSKSIPSFSVTSTCVSGWLRPASPVAT